MKCRIAMMFIMLILHILITTSCTSIENNHSNIISVEDVLVYLKSSSDYRDVVDTLCKIDIQKHEKANGEVVYFATLNSGDIHKTQLLQIELDLETGKIENIKNANMYYSASLIEYQLIDISQGEFILTYTIYSNDNGYISFIPLDQIEQTKYKFSVSGTYIPLDDDYSSYERIHEMLDIEEGMYLGISFAQKLTTDFRDLNGDGHTDIILLGMADLYYERNHLYNRYYCEFTYFYDPDRDDFYLDDVKFQELI